MMRKCFFFDRDGIVNEPPDPERYVTSVEKFHYIPAFGDAVSTVARHGFDVIMVTNQKGIATGAVSQEEVEKMHEQVRGHLARRGLALLDVLVSPYAEDEHPWRKPNPGMLVEAARRHEIDLSRSWMVGDQEKDVEAGKRAGCRTVRVLRGDSKTEADYCAGGMNELPSLLEEILSGNEGALP